MPALLHDLAHRTLRGGHLPDSHARLVGWYVHTFHDEKMESFGRKLGSDLAIFVGSEDMKTGERYSLVEWAPIWAGIYVYQSTCSRTKMRKKADELELE